MRFDCLCLQWCCCWWFIADSINDTERDTQREKERKQICWFRSTRRISIHTSQASFPQLFSLTDHHHHHNNRCPVNWRTQVTPSLLYAVSLCFAFFIFIYFLSVGVLLSARAFGVARARFVHININLIRQTTSILSAMHSATEHAHVSINIVCVGVCVCLGVGTHLNRLTFAAQRAYHYESCARIRDADLYCTVCRGRLLLGDANCNMYIWQCQCQVGRAPVGDIGFLRLCTMRFSEEFGSPESECAWAPLKGAGGFCFCDIQITRPKVFVTSWQSSHSRWLCAETDEVCHE